MRTAHSAPTSRPGVSEAATRMTREQSKANTRERLLAAIALDKKVQGKKVRWVLLEAVGRTVIRDDVPPEVVEAALDEVLR